MNDSTDVEKIYNKLVRDLIPEIINQSGKESIYHTETNKELIRGISIKSSILP
jgi:predicted house-cleaning noncanonical NTP pyrophosphatase (MazG superfamily)